MSTQKCAEVPKIKNENENASEKPANARRLTPGQLRAIELLAGGAKPGMVATTLSISRRALLKWRKKPHFIAEFDRLNAEVRQHSVERFRNLTTLSLDRLETHIRSNHPPTARLAAAVIVRMARLGEAVSQPPPEPKPAPNNEMSDGASNGHGEKEAES